MNWELIASSAVVVIGWFIGRYFEAKRDRANKSRDIRVEYLLKSYRGLARLAIHREFAPVAEDVEAAVADIQLLGTPKQVGMIRSHVQDWAEGKETAFDDLMFCLRTELRKELEMVEIDTPIRWFHITPNPVNLAKGSSAGSASQ
jgi:hypothetical protein